MPEITELREELADHLNECWPLLLNDGLQREIADEAIGFLQDRTA